MQNIQFKNYSNNKLLILASGYLVAINAFSVGLFWYDKHQATNKGWRVPEKQLQLTALLGGWIGGLWAMQTFRHKTVKQSFKTPYLMCVGGNVALMGMFAAGLRYPSAWNSMKHLYPRRR